MSILTEIAEEQRADRPERQQQGGEGKAMATLNSFLQERGSKFSQGISSPNTSWTSCSRLSPYLSWGHISLRLVIQTLAARQEQLRKLEEEGRNTGTWLRSLQAFSSRLHWRSHFIQKLESEPEMEKRDLCPAYQPLRRQEGDWNPDYYRAWETGKTGFPFVDACMRCLLQHGWLNFRMRAMLVSFATFNLWLDWKSLAPHLARVFLDYEPGIHYSQLQMQSGSTGINTMRVYNVTKQGKDQDPQGIFIRRYVPELNKVPKQYIHEPWKMPLPVQHQCKTIVGDTQTRTKQTENDWIMYPEPIVNEQESAKIAKAKVADVRKLESTKAMANKVYQQHGSRNFRRDEMNGKKPKALVSVVEKEDPSKQPKISSIFASRPASCDDGKDKSKNKTDSKAKASDNTAIKQHGLPIKRHLSTSEKEMNPAEKKLRVSTTAYEATGNWSCRACTFVNDKPLGLACSMCATLKTH
jgi:deoxyribodipyrimidine photo-lyase